MYLSPSQAAWERSGGAQARGRVFMDLWARVQNESGRVRRVFAALRGSREGDASGACSRRFAEAEKGTRQARVCGASRKQGRGRIRRVIAQWGGPAAYSVEKGTQCGEMSECLSYTLSVSPERVSPTRTIAGKGVDCDTCFGVLSQHSAVLFHKSLRAKLIAAACPAWTSSRRS